MSLTDKYVKVSKIKYDGKTFDLPKPVYTKSENIDDVFNAAINDSYYKMMFLVGLNKPERFIIPESVCAKPMFMEVDRVKLMNNTSPYEFTGTFKIVDDIGTEK